MVSLYVCDSHEHSHTKARSRGALPQAVVQVVDDLLKQNITNNDAIERKLKELNLPPLTIKQLDNYKQRNKTKIFGKPTTSFADLKAWCDTKMKIPDDVDE
jgi:hypothetical protein